MRKLLSILLLWVAILMFGATSVSAFSLGGYVGAVTFGMEDLYAWGRIYTHAGASPNGTYTATNSNPYYSDASGYNLAEWTAGQAGVSPGVEDSWGIARVDHIKRSDTGDLLWKADTASTELTVFFWDFEDDMLVQNQITSALTDIYQVGGHLQVYEDSSKNFTIGDVSQRTGINTYTTVTDGTLVLDYDAAAVRTYVDKNGIVSPYTALVNFDFSSTTGSGNMLLDVVGGTQQIYFDMNMRQGASDMKVDYSGDAYTGALGWTVHNGPTAYTNVPEPATMLLLGSGLLGLAGFGRKKLNKKS